MKVICPEKEDYVLEEGYEFHGIALQPHQQLLAMQSIQLNP